jgi:hypothetical protein
LVPSGWLILGGDLAVLQAPMFDGLSFDPFSLFDDRFCPAEVGIGGCDVFQALMITLVVTCVNRLAGDGKHTVATEMAEVAVAGYHRFEIADGGWVRLALKYKRITVLPPIGKARP